MDKISDHPRFRPASLKLEPGGAGIVTAALPENDMPAADIAGGAMTSMLTGCIINHAMQHGAGKGLDLAVSVFLSATVALEISEEAMCEILAMLPETRQSILDGLASQPSGPAPDPAS